MRNAISHVVGFARGWAARRRSVRSDVAVPDSRLIKDEIYQWTIDGVDIELRVRGRLLQRTRGPAHEPVATMATTSAVLGALAAGDTTIAAALESGGLILTGPAEAIRRMFIVTALPG